MDLPVETLKPLKSRRPVAEVVTPEVADWLQTHRVELNAMTSEQLIAWLERKLEEHGVEKVVPTSDHLADAYQRAVFRLKLEEAAEKLADELPDAEIPEDLMQQVRDHLDGFPNDSWDEAVAAIADDGES